MGKSDGRGRKREKGECQGGDCVAVASDTTFCEKKKSGGVILKEDLIVVVLENIKNGRKWGGNQLF